MEKTIFVLKPAAARVFIPDVRVVGGGTEWEEGEGEGEGKEGRVFHDFDFCCRFFWKL